MRAETARGTAAGQPLEGYGRLALSDGSARRIINNLAVNYDTDSDHGAGGVQVSGYLGWKHVRSTFSQDVYKGAVQIVGLETRYDVGRRIDIGLNLTAQRAGAAHDLAYSVGPSVGFSPKANTWISVGWNLKGFYDRDFQEARYTRQGLYLTARMKFDQFSLGRGGRQ